MYLVFISLLHIFDTKNEQFPLLQAKFFINVLAEPAEVVSFVYVPLLWEL